ncbi:MAG: YggT family protein [Clostridium sp.]|jgi:YggT family protein|nr:YggT family protein [Clostridium sp.]
MLRIFIRAAILLLDIMVMVLAARAISSWLPISREGAFFRILYKITDPIINPIRRLIQKSSFGRNMMLDFSPAIAILIIYIIKGILQTISMRI